MAAAAPRPARIGADEAIADHAIIGDCRTAALVSRSGSIDWLCLPHFSGPSLFAAILDRERGGRFAITPAGDFTSSRNYAGPTAVLETRFETREGIAKVTDAFVTGSRAQLEPMREVVRLVEGVEGAVAFDLVFEPRPDSGRARLRPRARGPDWALAWGDALLLLRSERPLAPCGDGAVGGRFVVRVGERIGFSLAYDKCDIGLRMPLGEAAAQRVRRTRAWWEGWAAGCRCHGPWQDAVERSAITLKLLTFALSGAVVAAPTASLPEWIGADRNWDYRYCWLRDASMTMRAFTGLGLQAEAAAFLRWLLHATALTRPRLQVVYDVFGRVRLPERELTHLSGHRGSRPVRIGNGAHRQLQLDVYGEVIAAADAFAAAGGRLQRDQLRLLAGFGETVCRLWCEPDHGIWEVRGGRRHYLFSKLMCWVALDRLIALGRRHGLELGGDDPRRERAAIAETIEARGYDAALSSYVGELDGDWIDASLLLMPSYGYGDPCGERQRATFERIDRTLGRGELVHRYEPQSDHLAAPEGAFGICSFWAVENLARCGEIQRATERFERLLARANDIGLFAEEIDPASGEALGNFPQAFTHVGLINAALALEQALAPPSGAADVALA